MSRNYLTTYNISFKAITAIPQTVSITHYEKGRREDSKRDTILLIPKGSSRCRYIPCPRGSLCACMCIGRYSRRFHNIIVFPVNRICRKRTATTSHSSRTDPVRPRQS
ncbi:hypothetical protein PUN28_017069 [Cardiocondyla obscurior]|uniref:Uncharacterized protein n=1 Tax=Cardiocondyla obscurior TaxID=286306 RepID=A0AAW2ENY9_9HYME